MAIALLSPPSSFALVLLFIEWTRCLGEMIMVGEGLVLVNLCCAASTMIAGKNVVLLSCMFKLGYWFI